jgi:predicted enzyme related to lactoylglutathione lyase
MKNAINWFEIPTVDFERAKNFYQMVFNCTMPVAVNEENFKLGILPSGQNGAGGAIIWNTAYKPSKTDGVLIYLNGNPDLQEVMNRIPSAGGSVLIEKRQISPQFGFMAMFIDTEGNRIALHSNQ